MNEINRRCVELFPELLEVFDIDELSEADEFGHYSLHEDFLMKLVVSRSHEKQLLEQLGQYIEELTCAGDLTRRHLAEVGLLESIIEHKLTEAVEYLGPEGTRSLQEVAQSMQGISLSQWLQKTQRK